MNTVTFILGAAATGKTTKANELVRGKKCFHMQSVKQKFYYKIPVDTEVILIDGFILSDLEDLKVLITSPYISIEKRGFDPVVIDRPEIIVASQYFLTSSVIYPRPHYTYIYCKKRQSPCFSPEIQPSYL